MAEQLVAAPSHETDNSAVPLNPQALLFLQTVYGRDARLERITQQGAEVFADELLYFYGEPNQEEQDTDAALFLNPHPRNNWRYELAAPAVAAYVRGNSFAEIMEEYPHAGHRDEVDIQITLNNVATYLRDLNRPLQGKGNSHEGAQPGVLDDLLNYYAGSAEEYGPLGTNRIAPMGETVVPIIESHHTVAWQGVQAELARDAERIEQLALEQIANTAEQAVAAYAATPEFQRAAARVGHEKRGEVFVIGPGDTDGDDEQSQNNQVLRHMAWLVSTAVFARKDGNTLEEMQEHRNDDYDFHFLAVDHSQGDARPMGALYAKIQSEDSLPSVQDIWYEWHEPIRQVMIEAKLPDLRYHPRVIDVLTVATLPEYDQSGANLIMYNRFGVLADTLGVEYIVNIFDQGPADQLNHFGDAFKSYSDRMVPQNYKARRPNANSSLPRYANMLSWQTHMWESDSKVMQRKATNFWGEHPTIGLRYQLPSLARFRRFNPNDPAYQQPGSN